MSERTEFRKMEFELDVSDDWPSVSSETVWVESLGDGKYRVDNSPFFVRELAVNGLVVGLETDGPFLTFVGKVGGGHSTIWIPLDRSVTDSLVESVRNQGCFVEMSAWHSLRRSERAYQGYVGKYPCNTPAIHYAFEHFSDRKLRRLTAYPHFPFFNAPIGDC